MGHVASYCKKLENNTMHIQELQKIYARLPQVAALAKALGKGAPDTICLDGLVASSTAMVFSGLHSRVGEGQLPCPVLLFIMQDAEEAGYFYHDLCQVMGDSDVLFFPSSYRRAIKYGQKDPASEILRTEVLTHLNEKGERRNKQGDDTQGENTTLKPNHIIYIVTYPEAIAEQVVTRRSLDDRTLSLDVGQTVSVSDVCRKLRDFGFREVDYVYEPGQFALRGSILDVYSFSCEYPFRVDFFDNDIDSMRTFDVENQLSRERRDHIDIVPEMATSEERESLLRFLPPQTVLVAKDFGYVRESVERAWQEGFSTQAMTERLENATEVEQYQIRQEMHRDNQIISGRQFEDDSERFRKILLGNKSEVISNKYGNYSSGDVTNQTCHLSLATYHFKISPQPLFHKNFDLLTQSLEDYLLKGYQLYVLADSAKQIDRLKDILKEKSGLTFEGVDRTLHEGYVDHDLRLCLFTDHQIFDRFHKYNLRSDKARGGKMALTLKEIQQFELGDFIVHIDHGVGKFGGLVRMPIQQTLPTGRGVGASSADKTNYSPPSQGGAGEGLAGSRR